MDIKQLHKGNEYLIKFGVEFSKMVDAIDAIVCDGFTGNVFLKTVEGMGKLVKRTLTESLKKNFISYKIKKYFNRGNKWQIKSV